jgi:hypothetical protein
LSDPSPFSLLRLGGMSNFGTGIMQVSPTILS